MSYIIALVLVPLFIYVLFRDTAPPGLPGEWEAKELFIWARKHPGFGGDALQDRFNAMSPAAQEYFASKLWLAEGRLLLQRRPRRLP